jgi:hypothetical protein
MKTMNASRRSHVAPTTEYMWVAVATLIVALVLGAFVGAPRAQAGDAQGSDLPFGLQSGLVSAHLDQAGMVIGGPGAKVLPFALQSGLLTAHLDSSGRVSGDLSAKALPFGLQSGLTSAHLDQRGRFAAQLDLTGGPGLAFGLESGLMSAHLDPFGRVATLGVAEALR